MKNKIFISVGTDLLPEQGEFVDAIKKKLEIQGLESSIVGKDIFGAGNPLITINEYMDKCVGTVIIALERSYFPSGIEKRGNDEKIELNNIKLSTPWNHVEAAMAYAKGQPLLIIVEKGLKQEGLLEQGYGWYVQCIKPEVSSLSTEQFNGILESWRKEVRKYRYKKIAKLFRWPIIVAVVLFLAFGIPYYVSENYISIATHTAINNESKSGEGEVNIIESELDDTNVITNPQGDVTINR